MATPLAYWIITFNRYSFVAFKGSKMTIVEIVKLISYIAVTVALVVALLTLGSNLATKSSVESGFQQVNDKLDSLLTDKAVLKTNVENLSDRTNRISDRVDNLITSK